MTSLILLSPQNQNQNQNSLLVKRQTDNTTPRGWGLTSAAIIIDDVSKFTSLVRDRDSSPPLKPQLPGVVLYVGKRDSRVVSALASCARGPGFDPRRRRGKFVGPSLLPFVSFAGMT